MKYHVEMTGWEYHIQTKSINNSEVEEAINEINDIWQLDEMHLSGEGDFEICALDNSGNSPLTVTIYDESRNILLEIERHEINHYSELEELNANSWDINVCIDPQYSDDYINTLYLEKDYKGSVFTYEIESDDIPKKEDFLFSYCCIETPKGDIDLINNLIYKSKILFGDLESGSSKGGYMCIYTSDGENIDIEE